MPQFDKLLSDVGPDQTPARAARRALKVRLRAVVYYLDQAADSGRQKAETIHQLRIWTRRSAAALKLFSPLLPPRKSRKLKKVLRRVRRGAGAVRDLDVVQQQLEGALAGPLAQRLQKQRKTAEKELRRLVRRYGDRGKLRCKSKRLIKRLNECRDHASNGVTFGIWCRGRLAPLAEEFLNHAAGGPRQSDAGLHQWRLATKHLRYALELAVAAMPKQTWSRLYEQLSLLQERLGRICDALVERQRLRQWRRETTDVAARQVLARLSAAAWRRLSVAKRHFARWWTRQRREETEELCRGAVGKVAAARRRRS